MYSINVSKHNEYDCSIQYVAKAVCQVDVSAILLHKDKRFAKY
jgi:hypothetical protein